MKSVNFTRETDIMSAIDIKSELKKLIESENDLSLLESIRTILQKTRLDKTLQSKLTTRALKSEEDIKEGKILTREEVEKRFKKKQ